jgi:phosphatidylserine/phosphatidylglycerophosphate/cardiolipin synthase-like enzyme
MANNPFISSLCDEKSFFNIFLKDLRYAKTEVIIESPFITTTRMNTLAPALQKLVNKGIKVYVITRDPKEHQLPYREQSELEIRHFEQIGIQVLICKGNHHRKLAIIDREILWEGSLNILSQSRSREIMRRIEGNQHAMEMFNYLELGRFL